MGQRTFPLGTEPARASLTKLAGNFMIAATIETLGEALAFVGKAGIDPGSFVELSGAQQAGSHARSHVPESDESHLHGMSLQLRIWAGAACCAMIRPIGGGPRAALEHEPRSTAQGLRLGAWA
ncbi:MAG TPA: NAD-binding protein [Steroidobacteraceae bacterium]|nr:NAD-binding protein [Steroidobacteraceae bacterium]